MDVNTSLLMDIRTRASIIVSDISRLSTCIDPAVVKDWTVQSSATPAKRSLDTDSTLGTQSGHERHVLGYAQIDSRL